MSQIRWWESGRNLGFVGTVVATIVATWVLAVLDKLPNWASTIGRAAIRPVPVPLIVLVPMVVILLGVGVYGSCEPSAPRRHLG